FLPAQSASRVPFAEFLERVREIAAEKRAACDADPDIDEKEPGRRAISWKRAFAEAEREFKERGLEVDLTPTSHVVDVNIREELELQKEVALHREERELSEREFTRRARSTAARLRIHELYSAVSEIAIAGEELLGL